MTKRRFFSLLALILALTMCFTVFTACEMDEDDDDDRSSGNASSSASAVKTYIYNYADMSEIEDFRSYEDFDPKKWKSTSSFDLASQWNIGNDGFGVNFVKLENTSSLDYSYDVSFNIKGDLGDYADSIKLIVNVSDADGEHVSDSGIMLLGDFYQGEIVASGAIPAGETYYLTVNVLTYGDFADEMFEEPQVTEKAEEFGAKVYLKFKFAKVKAENDDFNGNYEKTTEGWYEDTEGWYDDTVEYTTDIALTVPANCDFYDLNMYGYISYYDVDYVVAYDAYLIPEQKLYGGNDVTILGISTDGYWCKIDYNGSTWYVESEYVEIYEESETENEPWWEETTEPWWEETETEYVWEDETYDISYPDYCEFEGMEEEIVRVKDFIESTPLFDSVLNEIIEVSGGTELTRVGISTDPEGYWSAVVYNNELFYICSYLLEGVN